MLLLAAAAGVCPAAAGSRAEPTPARAPLPAEDRCTWEPRFDLHHIHPFHEDADACRRYAESRGHEWIGVESDYASPPSRACTCGEVVSRWRFNPAPGGLEKGCEGYVYSCSRPGTGCRWTAIGGVSVGGLQTSSACREHAQVRGDPYLGLGVQAEASESPSGACVCGEARTHWYAVKQDSWDGMVCAGYRYRCLAPIREERTPRGAGPGSP